MKNQYDLKRSVPYEILKNIVWAVQNKKLVTIYEKLLNNKKILYLLSIEKTEKEIAGIMGYKVRRVSHTIVQMSKAAECRGKLGLIQIAYKLKIIK